MKGTFTLKPASAAAFSMAAFPARTIRSASEIFLPSCDDELKSFLIPNVDHKLVTKKDVTYLKEKILASGLSVRTPTFELS